MSNTELRFPVSILKIGTSSPYLCCCLIQKDRQEICSTRVGRDVFFLLGQGFVVEGVEGRRVGHVQVGRVDVLEGVVQAQRVRVLRRTGVQCFT